MAENISLKEVVAKKQRGQKITMLTAYDHPMAVFLDRAGIDLILVGDSLANVVLGLDSTVQVGMDVMLHHVKAVTRGAKRAPVIADMPFEAYQPVGADAVANARLFVEAGCAAVKVEWFTGCIEVVKALRGGDIEVVGHVGLTPQTAETLGVRGRSQEEAHAIFEQAEALEAAGCMMIVIECVPEKLTKEITATLRVPVIGIGAGKYCDGQVLVTHDILTLNERKVPKFVKRYANAGGVIMEAVRAYRGDVERGDFPGKEHTFH
jgi:3-methyl-2-oxobutanoate hydroxymethyltransferase